MGDIIKMDTKTAVLDKPAEDIPEVKKRKVSIVGVFDGALWRTEYSLPEYFLGLGYEVKTYNYRGNMNVGELNNPDNQDFIVVLNGGGMPVEYLVGIKSHIFLWHSELLNNWNNMDDIAKHKFHLIKNIIPYFDGIAVHDVGSIKAMDCLTDSPIKQIYGAGIRWDYHIDPDDNPKKQVIFSGNLDPYRKQEIKKIKDALKDKGIDVDVPDYVTDPFMYRNMIQDHYLALNIHFSPSENTEHRLSEVLGFNVPVLSQPITMPELFDDAIKSGHLRIAKTEDMPDIICEMLKDWKPGTPRKLPPIDRSKLPQMETQVKTFLDFCEDIVQNVPKKTDFRPKDPPPITLALSMIMKDSASIIGRALENPTKIKGVFDGIYLKDTGSSREYDCTKCNQTGKILKKNIEFKKCPHCGADKKYLIITNPTLEEAEKYTDKIKEIPWKWFGPTRNIAKEDIKEDFVVSLDVDEIIPDEVMKILKPVIRECYRDGNLGLITDILMEPNKNGVPASRFSTMRIFKNHPRIKWQNKIHNVVKVDDLFVARDYRIYFYHSRDAIDTFEQNMRTGQRYSGNVEKLLEQYHENLGSYKCGSEKCDYQNDKAYEIPDECPSCHGKKIEILKPIGDLLHSYMYLGNTNNDHYQYEKALEWYTKFVKYAHNHDGRLHDVYFNMAKCCMWLRHAPILKVKCNKCGYEGERDTTDVMYRCPECKSKKIEFFQIERILDSREYNRLLMQEMGYLQKAIGSNPYDPCGWVHYADLCNQMGNFPAAEMNMKIADMLLPNIPKEEIKHPQIFGGFFYDIYYKALRFQGKIDEALQMVNKYLALDPNNQAFLKIKQELIAGQQMLPPAPQQQQQIAQSIEVRTDRKNMLIFSPQMDFIEDMLNKWTDQQKYQIMVFPTPYGTVPDQKKMREGLEKVDIAWFEFGNEALVHGTKILEQMPKRPFVITRIHGYECFTGYFQQINWNVVDRIVWVADHLKELGIEQDKRIASRKNIIIPGGINIENFTIEHNKKKGNKACFAGRINQYKDLYNGIEVFEELSEIIPNLEYHIAGTVQEGRIFTMFMRDVKRWGYEGKVFYHEWQKDLNAFYADKDIYISSSIIESLNYSLVQAMAAGLYPIIRDWESALKFFPKDWIYHKISEVKKVYENVTKLSREDIRNYVCDNLSLKKEMESFEKLFTG